MTDINHPDVVAELTAIYAQYEQALVNNDIPTLMDLFWDSPHVIRFGVRENLYGRDQIEQFRQQRPTTHLEREILNQQVVTFGTDTGAVTVEFRRVEGGVLRQGRQSQYWKKFPVGWRIVSAHVSLLPMASR